MGGENASVPGDYWGKLWQRIALCGAVGACSGWLIARYKVPPFIVTLAGMQIASGFAFIVAQGQSIYAIPGLVYVAWARNCTLLHFAERGDSDGVDLYRGAPVYGTDAIRAIHLCCRRKYGIGTTDRCSREAAL